MEFRQAYEGLRRSYEEGMAHGSPEWVAALFAEDTVMLTPGAAPLTGRAAVLAHIQDMVKRFRIQVKIETTETQKLGEKGWATGSYQAALTPHDGGEQLELTGNYLQILQPREDGTLEILRHCVAADQPLP